MYKLKLELYEKLLSNTITKSYKNVRDSVRSEINQEARDVAKKFKLEDRNSVMPEKNSFITLKDHKNNFENEPKCRLINPTKSNLGKISKVILKKIDTKIREETNLNQWISTYEAIEWFDNIQNKVNKEFIQCDIENYYPSVSEDLLMQALDFASKYTTITKKEREPILHTRKSILINHNEVWTKKDGIFDVAMGAYDSAEISDLVG